MKPHFWTWTALSLACSIAAASEPERPELVDARKIDPTLIVAAAYASKDNFTGQIVPGYEAAKCLLTRPAAEALKRIQKKLSARGYGLKLFDCYRPAAAVRYFAGAWLQSPDQSTRSKHYPSFESKMDLFKNGFISSDSKHARGSTVDLTLVRKKDRKELEMGTCFDFFGPEATWAANATLSQTARENRERLREAMAPEFEPYEAEWWHFRLKSDPYSGPMLEVPVR